ncbi:MAG: hypothetical protein FJW31_26065 [Acidobacteria bacterium]|nr:hypothetical protein [Acidobacteriota bacterium]
MARDWTAAAAAIAPDIPADQIARITPSLDALEAVFRPLVAAIPYETEAAPVMLVAREKDA